MTRFVHAHARNPDWRTALGLAKTDIAAQLSRTGIEPTLGWIYFSDSYAEAAEPLLVDLAHQWPGVAWVGAVGIGIAASGIEYFDQPALVLMLADLPSTQFKVFSGASPLSAGATTDFEAATALVHADPTTADLGELIVEMADRTATRYLFGGLASSRNRSLHIANGVYQGGISGVAFSHDVSLLSRVTQGCQPVGPVRRISACEHNLVTTLDGQPALDCMLGDLQLQGREAREIFPRLRETLVGLSDRSDDALSRPGQFGTDTRVRHLIGIDPGRRAIAIGDVPPIGMQLTFCRRDTEAARRDLIRICSEIREELEPDEAIADGQATLRTLAGAIYISCSGRGGPHFGAPSAELAIIRHALGDVPLVGFFAAGEIARHHLYGYTGVLTVFTN